MRVGFISDPLIVVRKDGTTRRYPPLVLLDVPHAWSGSAPQPDLDLYAGVVELDAIQTQNLLDRAQAAGLQLALVLDIDGATGTAPFSVQENLRLTTWITAKGFPGPGVLEGQIDYVQRLQVALNSSCTMDCMLAAVAAETTVLAAIASAV